MQYRKNLLIQTAFCALLAIGSITRSMAQTDAERQQIRAAYQAAAIKAGKGANALKQQEDSIKARFQRADDRVQKYLLTHPGQQRSYTINGKLYYIQDIEPNGMPLIITTKDLECSSVIKSTSMYSGGSLGLNISGQGMTAGIWDGGRIRASHELFQNRATHLDTAQRLSDHMAHVAGDLMGGDIAANRAARGIAFNANASCYYWDYDAAEYSQFGSNGGLVSNHSYGRGNTAESQWVFGAYNYQAKNVDAILALRPDYLQVWAGGNEQQINNNTGKAGYDVMTGESASKNGFCVGALNADGTMSNFSNWGPTDDGRIKPDICAKGVGMTSAYSGADNQYNTGNGTSYAAPSISGLALLLQQYYKTLNPAYMEAAGVRGLMMHTATDLGQPGPDYKFGWGMANGEKATQTIMTANADFTQTNSDNKLAKITTNPAVGGDVTYTVSAKGGSTPLSISISWTDDAGPQQDSTDGIDPTTGRLIYNFDIKVTAPNGTTTFYPWSGPGMANRTANATRNSPNNVDNFKRVDIDAPIADGVYTITITKRASSLAADRAFTLIATGLRNTAADINFNQLTGTVTEATTGTTGTCINYRDYTFSMAIANAPVGDATVTLSVDAASTAAEGKHFDISTNGVFGTGSSKTLTFANGATAAQNYTVRVYDDAMVNPNETIRLSFTTTGGNAMVGKNAANTLITITDNDNPVTVIAPTSVTAGSTAGTASGQSSPLSRSYADLLMDNYFTAAELTAAGLVAGSNITGLSLNVTLKQSTTALPGFSIRLGHITTAPSTSTGFLNASSYTPCYTTASLSTTLGTNTFNFSTPFVWNGTDNVAVRYCYNGTVDRGNTDFDEVSILPDALGTGVRSVIFYYENAGANADGCTLSTDAFANSANRPVTNFIYLKSGTAIETNAAAAKAENLNSTGGQYNFYSAANKLIASVAAPAQNGACTEAKVEAAGTGFTSFSSGQRSNKVWKITPAANAATNTYTVTLYMTAAELAGQNPATLKIYKSSAADIASMDQTNTATAPTTVVSNSEYTSFTASFTGFSLFTIGTPTVILPLNLVTFTGVKAAGYNQLAWKTTGEKGTKLFELETSTDGVSFTQKAVVPAAGSGNNSYHYNDATAFKGRVFYRLKMVDADGKFTYSSVVLITGDAQPAIAIFPNPATDVVNIYTGNTTLYKKAALYNADGRLLQSIVLTSNLQKVPVKTLANGIYLLKFDDGTVLRFIKE